MASAGVKTIERDASQNLKTLGETAGAMVGSFVWGAIDENINVSDEGDLLQYFGKPDNTNFVDWFSAYSFLHYTGKLIVRRIAPSTALNASSGSAGALIKNSRDYDFKESTLTEEFYAKYAGDLGNSLTVSVADSATYDSWEFKDEFDTKPSSSDYSNIYMADANDEMHVIIIDRLGKFTGVPNSILEKYAYVSKSKDGIDVNNQNSYYKNVINRASQYVWVGGDIGDSHTEDASDKQKFGDGYDTTQAFVSLSTAYKVNLSGGVTGGLAEKSAYVSAYQELCNIDDNEVAVIFTGNCGGDNNHADVVNAIGAEVYKNQKRVGFFSPKISDVVGVSNEQQCLTNIMNTYNAITQMHSYMSMATGVKMVYDKYNDKYRWIPTNADEAGVFARIHNTEGKWVSGAGYNKGVYANAIGLAYNPNQNHRDKLYAKNINPVIQENGAGILLYGDKTLQGKNSTFSFLGTRFLFIELRIIIAEASKFILWEFNDEYTRSQFRDLVIPALRDIKGKRGLHNFLVVCDDTNNTPKVIQDGLFIGDIYIKPNYSIQNILLRFTSVNRTLSFEEVVTKGE